MSHYTEHFTIPESPYTPRSIPSYLGYDHDSESYTYDYNNLTQEEQTAGVVIPEYVHKLRLNTRGKPVPVLSETVNLSLLEFSRNDRFNQPLTGLLPTRRLRWLRFGVGFNQPISRGDIPDTVQMIDFCDCSIFNHPLTEENLGNTVVCELTIPHHYEHHLTSLPKTIKHITLTGIIGQYDEFEEYKYQDELIEYCGENNITLVSTIGFGINEKYTVDRLESRFNLYNKEFLIEDALIEIYHTKRQYS